MVTLTKEVTDRLAEAFQKGRQLPVHLTSRCLRTGLAENHHVELGHHTAVYIYIHIDIYIYIHILYDSTYETP